MWPKEDREPISGNPLKLPQINATQIKAFQVGMNCQPSPLTLCRIRYPLAYVTTITHYGDRKSLLMYVSIRHAALFDYY